MTRSLFLTEVRTHGVLRLRGQVEEQLIGVQTSGLNQLLRCANDLASDVALKGLGLEGKGDVVEALRSLG